MSESGPPGWRFYRSALALIIFLFNVNCLIIPQSERSNLPSAIALKACKSEIIPLPAPPVDYRTPTQRLDVDHYPPFQDDLDLNGMEMALQRQLERFNRRPLQGTITFGEDNYKLVAVKESLEKFLHLVRHTTECIQLGEGENRTECFSQFNRSVSSSFAVYIPKLGPEDPRYGEAQPTLFTGYYTPHLQVSLWPTSEYNIPIYAKPNDEWVSRVGRYQIDFRNILAGQGLELYYAKDRFSVYLLQLEGGGRVSFQDQDGHTRSVYISYAGSNGRQWRFLSTQMLKRNWILNPAVPFQRKFIADHPELAPEIFSYCPSYVYFRETYHPPEGSDSVSLTDNRSIATDNKNYGFKGVLTFVQSKRPRPLQSDGGDKDIEMMPFSRFMLDQDTGGAIRGKARADLYFGEGDYAELAANTIKQRGDIYFLMLNSEAEK